MTSFAPHGLFFPSILSLSHSLSASPPTIRFSDPITNAQREQNVHSLTTFIASQAVKDRADGGASTMGNTRNSTIAGGHPFD